ncbi:thermonuclease family protein (plasmid) [Cupriavidus necator]|nr:thermonuclease family protein [Cupriavidus necator]UIF88642.1 thermonuclease family protein [Cupriavidus necator]
MSQCKIPEFSAVPAYSPLPGNILRFLKPSQAQSFGNFAKKALSDLTYNRAVVVEGAKHDRYGRLVGKVLVNGRDVNIEMVRRGLAWHYTKYKREQSPDDRVQYEKAEEAARLQRIGLWLDPHPIAPWDFRRRSRGNTVAAQRQSALNRR